MSLHNTESTYPVDFQNLYRSADEKTRGRFRARKSYWLNKNHSEEEAISKALEVFQTSTTVEIKPITSKYEPTESEVKAVVKQLMSIQNSAKVIDFPSKDQNEQELPSNHFSLSKILSKVTRYTFIKLALYSLIVPVTAVMIQEALRSASLEENFLTLVSWVLAIVTDYIALDHFSKAKEPMKRGEDLLNLSIASLILIANLVGAYLLFGKQLNLESTALKSSEISAVEADLQKAEGEASQAEANYLVKKWPKAVDPKTCEAGSSSNCGPMYAAGSKQEKVAYIAAKSQLEKLKQKQASLINSHPNNSTKTDFWWHLGYYAFIWFLLLSVIRLEKISRRRSNAVAA
ncbi:hypothetical protein [Pseudobacteriovorax antillogorgiicola]|uniref:Uncharacterized protein n=1 Tax=Pseudobacteriovorax antillogorgiicola TaxID=1513793 RepID=A0A1Y6CPT4_9BACT|nr:hypothetical protein [Pseudobacteriovorax antillogorgiicola]TCS44214.1 hypothetical protein EDD56_13414 [Pseudobacteriovorax antillogorgiicola]SMF80455.1 hypothetical protein SAMN06296036_13515 [Pseudobacteriovorax antillogorgiicola]